MRLNRKHSAGFGLVEVMVAMLIGMFGVMVMMQVLAVSEEQKRTTTGGNDALNEGVMALYALQSDVRMSGYEISDKRIMGCSLLLRTGVKLNSLAPVTINSSNITGADAGTDTLLVFYGNGTGTPQGDLVFNTTGGNNLQTPSMFATNDWVMNAPATRPSPCDLTLAKVDTVVGSIVTLLPSAVLPLNSTLFNIGQSFRAVGYAVRGGNLTMCDFADTTKDCTVATNWSSIANNIVSLRAQYGRDTAAGAMDGIVDIYDQTTPSGGNTACAWARISAVRLAIVSRSVQFEKTVVTSNLTSESPPAAPAPVWDGQVANNPVGSTASPIDLSGNANWKNYRYKVFQTVVPIRNVSWMGVVPSC
jgi:type IV pilus assembly protein PilW